jgi:hypothetical protein
MVKWFRGGLTPRQARRKGHGSGVCIPYLRTSSGGDLASCSVFVGQQGQVSADTCNMLIGYAYEERLKPRYGTRSSK